MLVRVVYVDARIRVTPPGARGFRAAADRGEGCPWEATDPPDGFGTLPDDVFADLRREGVKGRLAVTAAWKRHRDTGAYQVMVVATVYGWVRATVAHHLDASAIALADVPFPELVRGATTRALVRDLPTWWLSPT